MVQIATRRRRMIISKTYDIWFDIIDQTMTQMQIWMVDSDFLLNPMVLRYTSRWSVDIGK